MYNKINDLFINMWLRYNEKEIFEVFENGFWYFLRNVV